MTTAVIYNGTTSPVHVRLYQVPMGRVTSLNLASPITIELHRAAVDAYASQPLVRCMNLELTARIISIGWYRPPRGVLI